MREDTAWFKCSRDKYEIWAGPGADFVQEVWKLGRAEMGIEKEEREKTRAYKLGNVAEDVMGSQFARERRHRDKL